MKREVLAVLILLSTPTANSQDLSNMLNAPVENWESSYYTKGIDAFQKQPFKLIQYQLSELVRCELDLYQNAFSVSYQGRIIDEETDMAFYDLLCAHSGMAWRVVMLAKPRYGVMVEMCGLGEGSTVHLPCFSDGLKK